MRDNVQARDSAGQSRKAGLWSRRCVSEGAVACWHVAGRMAGVQYGFVVTFRQNTSQQ